MVRRSVLFAPGDAPEKLRKATQSGADVVVFDLEDGVALADKAAARSAVRDALVEVDTVSELCVRVNPPNAGMADDLDGLLGGRPPDSVMLPKTNAPEDVETLAGRLGEHGVELPVLALIETAAGVLAADAIASESPTDALLFGAEDLAADIGASRTPEGTEVLYARQRIVIAAAAGGVEAIDTVHTDYSDEEGLRAETDFAAQLGYDGKMVIHPDQVSVVNRSFTPSAERIAWAERVVAAARESEAGVFGLDGEMIDAPLVAQAERILDLAEHAERR